MTAYSEVTFYNVDLQIQITKSFINTKEKYITEYIDRTYLVFTFDFP